MILFLLLPSSNIYSSVDRPSGGQAKGKDFGGSIPVCKSYRQQPGCQAVNKKGNQKGRMEFKCKAGAQYKGKTKRAHDEKIVVNEVKVGKKTICEISIEQKTKGGKITTLKRRFDAKGRLQRSDIETRFSKGKNKNNMTTANYIWGPNCIASKVESVVKGKSSKPVCSNLLYTLGHHLKEKNCDNFKKIKQVEHWKKLCAEKGAPEHRKPVAKDKATGRTKN